MTWEVIAFESSRGDKYVEDFLKSCQARTISKAGELIDLLEKHGPLLTMPYSKKITKEMYELRIRGIQEIRIIYVIMKI
jgi:hypothetical protein